MVLGELRKVALGLDELRIAVGAQALVALLEVLAMNAFSVQLCRRLGHVNAPVLGVGSVGRGSTLVFIHWRRVAPQSSS